MHIIENTPDINAHKVRQFCAASGRAGVFFRVLTPGHVREGDIFRRVRRGEEQWSAGPARFASRSARDQICSDTLCTSKCIMRTTYFV